MSFWKISIQVLLFTNDYPYLGLAKIKLYKGEEGQFKGDALVVYFKEESVNLACTMLDETPFELESTESVGNMRVQPVTFNLQID